MMKFKTENIIKVNDIKVEDFKDTKKIFINFQNNVAIHPDSIELIFSAKGYSEFIDKFIEAIKQTSIR